MNKEEMKKYIIEELEFSEKYAEDIMEEAMQNYNKYKDKIKLTDERFLEDPCSYMIEGYELDDWFRYCVSTIFDPFTISQIIVKIINEKRITHILIDGSLWVNNAKYEYVDKIVITDQEVLIYYKEKEIGCILRKNIKTLVEQNYKENIMTDLIDNLSYLFDITKPNDL